MTYTLIADGSAIMESLFVGATQENMVTVYSISNGNTVLTHYCSMGNQPRMKLNGSKSTEAKLVFSYIDATNVKSDRAPRMHDLTLILSDKDHFSQEWTLKADRASTVASYAFERVRTSAEPSGW